MRIECQRHDNLTPFQEDAVRQLAQAVYPKKAAKLTPPPFQWAAKTWSLLIWEGEMLVSLIGMLTRDGRFEGQPVRLGGIGSVKTHPETRGRGYAGAGMSQAASFLTDEQQVAFSVLFCREALLGYYARFGWQPFAGQTMIEQPAGKLAFTFNETMVLAGQQAAPVAGVLDLCGKPW